MIRRFRLAGVASEVVVRVSSGMVEVRVGPEVFRFRLVLAGRHQGKVVFPEGSQPFWFSRLGAGAWQLFFAGEEHAVALEDPLKAHARTEPSQDGQEELVAPIPGRVVQVLVAAGAEVTAGTPILVLEAMKMQNLITTQVGGRVREVRVQPGNAVEAGQVLAVVG